MRRLLLIAAAALALVSCTKGDIWFQSEEHVAAVKLSGVSDVVLERPSFVCDANSTEPRSGMGGDSQYLQTGFFYRGKMNGVVVRGAICAGKARPPRISIFRPNASAGGVLV